MERNGTKYTTAQLSVNDYGIGPNAIVLIRPFVSLSTSISETIQWHVTFDDITPEELEEVAAHLRRALNRYYELQVSKSFPEHEVANG